MNSQLMNTDNTSTAPVPMFDLMNAAFASTASIVESVSSEELTLPTPCPGWPVATVIDHIAGALEMFAGALGLESPTGDSLESSHRVRNLGACVATGWTTPGRMASTVVLPFGSFPAPLALRINIVETFVHGLDIAVAVCREGSVEPGLCHDIHLMAEAAGFDAFRQPEMFGQAVTPRDDSALSTFMAFVGRSI